MFNLVLSRLSLGVVILLMASCGMVTKPIRLVTGAVVKPVKVVTDAGVGLLRKPVGAVTRMINPSSGLRQIRP